MPRPEPLKLGAPAPDFALRDATSGASIRLSDLRGSIVVLNFDRGTYCGTCRPFQRSLRDANPQFEATGARLFSIFGESKALGILHLNAPEAVRKFAAREHLPFPVLVDPDCAIGKQYGVYVALNYETISNARPATFIIDDAGILRFIHISKRQSNRLKPAQILAELEKLQTAK